MQRFQQTLAAPVELEEVGIFSGQKVRIVLEPAEAGEGVTFVLEGVSGAPRIPLRPEHVLGTEGATVLSDGYHSVYMVEHLLSALHGLGIDNVVVRVFGPEIPLFDGSAEVFVREILRQGLRLQPALKRYLEVLRPFEVRNGVGCLRFRPAPEFRLRVRIAFDHPLIGEQILQLTLNPLNYQKELAFARTFGFKEDLLRRKEKGLLRGGDLSNALVLDESRVLNGPLHRPDEFVRHKALDLVGDLFAAGIPFRGEVEAELSGHRLHIEALKNLLSAPGVARLSDGLAPVAFFFLAPKKRSFRAHY
ncbi:UDP-3-O-[3-hydroxymyristoyl] N-acetylglucosamine deacetylase [Thermosulfurimonas marina]|uniref:UDP-3-O-acyl-N-acetylglucosamine deacetylase n=1 Tax=Thermosulfurimonas marina TaxID=2047767 RepID=A0A6H1WSC3_9BACT|nr:UDP-3-O-acyl-N-acetylglucosamine deacetylase [Thermosulfurimonas marina]QJA06082.1 UDP-3-O-[3-hydroxymyristoyl] N-acetylglucosamine deacetylase [Thermosulfurimonas marina]